MTKNWVDLDAEVVDIDQALSWARQFCPSYVTNNVVVEKLYRGRYGYVTTIRYRFYFAKESEQALFALKWTKN